MLHKYKMLPLVAVMLVMSLVFSAQAAPVVPDFVPLVQSARRQYQYRKESHAAGRYAFRNVPRASPGI